MTEARAKVPGPTGVTAYGEFLKDELDVQGRRQASLEQRGLAVVTTSGALATLLFALASLSTKEHQTFVLPHSAELWLKAALISFLVAAVLALLTNLPMPYEAVTADAIRDRLRETPIRDEPSAQKDIAFTRVKELRHAKKTNGRKALLLLFALCAQVLAVGGVAGAVWVVV